MPTFCKPDGTMETLNERYQREALDMPTDPTYHQRCEESASKRGAPLDECRQAFEAWRDYYCRTHGIGSRWDEIEAAWQAAWNHPKR